MGGKQQGTSNNTISAENSGATALSQIGGGLAQRSNLLAGFGIPEVQAAGDFYGSLSTGDPSQIARVTAPAAQQITQASESATKNILANAPPGGEKNLALEQVEQKRGAQVGDVATQGYLGSFNALGALGGQNLQASNATAGTGISAYGTGEQALGQVGQQEFQNAQFQAQQKGATMGAIASLAGDAAMLA
jgi:hypothetical protein